MSATCETQAVVVKRYARSRLHDVTNRCYVTVEQLRRWVTEDTAFSVIDAKTGEDITRIILA